MKSCKIQAPLSTTVFTGNSVSAWCLYPVSTSAIQKADKSSGPHLADAYDSRQTMQLLKEARIHVVERDENPPTRPTVVHQMFIECSEAEKAFRGTESPLWWTGELPEPCCQGFLLGGGAANNDEKGRAVRACCGLVRHFYDGVPRRQGRERNTDHACLISCQHDCTKSSYNDLNFVQKHSDHPLMPLSTKFMHEREVAYLSFIFTKSTAFLLLQNSKNGCHPTNYSSVT